MNLIIRLLLNAIAVFALANISNGVQVDGYLSAIIVAIVLSILNLSKAVIGYFNSTNNNSYSWFVYANHKRFTNFTSR